MIANNLVTLSLITRLQEDRERPYKTMEQRLAAYRQECETRLQEEVQRQVPVSLSRPIELQASACTLLMLLFVSADC